MECCTPATINYLHRRHPLIAFCQIQDQPLDLCLSYFVYTSCIIRPSISSLGQSPSSLSCISIVALGRQTARPLAFMFDIHLVCHQAFRKFKDGVIGSRSLSHLEEFFMSHSRQTAEHSPFVFCIHILCHKALSMFKEGRDQRSKSFSRISIL